ncbi:synaptic vesicle glycoprotein 2C [Drosophila innubila]|uniref:synaptic vesicle glycoprotein 2C n=1 Tax=Drosophila innubila TaxID=198719 RepID=UPI00148CD880|nr:synaptic vesicle glycoprotein 2C [Drosophila innubila]
MQHLNTDRNATPDELEYDEILEKIGYGKTQWILLIVSGLLTITSVAAQTSMGIVVLASHCEFHTTQSEKGVMMAACVAGIFLSNYIWGYVSDAIGRRSVLLYGIFICNGLQFILMFVSSVWLFNIINLICGISLGGVSGGLYPYLSEFNIPRHRAVTINYSTMFVSLTAIYVPATAWLILSSDWSINLLGDFVFRPWRLIMLCNLLPGLIGGLILIIYPESPKILLSLNKDREALDAVDWISKFNRGLTINQVLNRNEFTLKPEIQSDENILANHRGCNILINIARATRPLFQKPHGFNFILCNVAVIGLFFSSNGMQFWFPEIVNRTSSTGSNTSSTVCEILDNSFMQPVNNASMTDSVVCINPISTKTYIDNMIVGVAFLIGFSVQGLLLNPFGRKNVLMGAIFFSILSGILLHIVSNTTAVLALFCLYILLPGLSISIMLGAIVDLVPTHLRGKAVSLSMSLGRLGIIAATNLIGIMLEPYCNTTFALLTFILIVCIITVFRLPIKNSE